MQLSSVAIWWWLKWKIGVKDVKLSHNYIKYTFIESYQLPLLFYTYF